MGQEQLQGEQGLSPAPRALSPIPDAVSSKLQGSNIFTIAKRNVEGQDMLYQSLKLTNGIWVLAELRIQPSNPSFMVHPLPSLLPSPAGGTSLVVLVPALLSLSHGEGHTAPVGTAEGHTGVPSNAAPLNHVLQHSLSRDLSTPHP